MEIRPLGISGQSYPREHLAVPEIEAVRNQPRPGSRGSRFVTGVPCRVSASSALSPLLLELLETKARHGIPRRGLKGRQTWILARPQPKRKVAPLNLLRGDRW